MTLQAALAGKKNEKKARRSVFSKCSYLYLKTLLMIIPTGKCNIACFVVKLIKTVCNSLVLCLPTKMGTKKHCMDGQVSLKKPEDSNLPDNM